MITWIEEDLLRDAAFEMLSSSSLNRYVQMAKLYGRDSALRDHLMSGSLALDSLIGRARELRRQIAVKKLREIEEVELALILAILSEAASDQVSQLLIELSLYDVPPLTWVSGLARKLHHSRASNLISPTQLEDSWSREQAVFLSLQPHGLIIQRHGQGSDSIDDFASNVENETAETKDLELGIAS